MQGRLGGLIVVGCALGVIVVVAAIAPKHESVAYKNNGVILAEKESFVKSSEIDMKNLPYKVRGAKYRERIAELEARERKGGRDGY